MIISDKLAWDRERVAANTVHFTGDFKNEHLQF